MPSEEKPMGTYEVNWKAANLPSSVYFNRLLKVSFIEKNRTVLIK